MFAYSIPLFLEAQAVRLGGAFATYYEAVDFRAFVSKRNSLEGENRPKLHWLHF